MQRIAFLTFLLLAACPVVAQQDAERKDRPNVLFIAVDDLRPQLACYGQAQMHTPNFDALADRGVLFERAFCMVPTCGASRASLMTGLRPHPRRFTSYTARADKEAPDAITLNTHFKANGYTTISLGKVFHFTGDSENGWSEQPWRSRNDDYGSKEVVRKAIAEHVAKYGKPTKKNRGPAYHAGDHGEENYRDHDTASQAIEYLNRLAKDDAAPFFLAVGFVKPHLPFCAPRKYWDLYDFDTIDVPENFAPPTNTPDGAFHTSGELRAYSGIPPKGQLDRQAARHLIHGYYACVSFIDAQLGRLLKSLDENGLSDNTIVVLWGDHGWQLGEHGMWNKHSCFETSMHTPLFVAAPGVAGGKTTKALTEFIDIYPTLCDLADIEKPTHLEGKSFAAQLSDPTLPGKEFAIGRFQQGDTIRSDQFRYTQYRSGKGLGRPTGQMLYDHTIDPNENDNVASDEDRQSTVKLLSRELNSGKGKPPKQDD